MATDINTKYDPVAVEDKWYRFWMEHRFFHSEPDSRPAYSIVIPPPNVTGVLHMGHMLNNTIQDVMIRRARMRGFNAVWVPGTDHASIATEAKVVAYLKEQGIDKKDLTREEFLKHAWEWKEKYGGIILKQLRKLGASCDWDRTKFTMDPEMSEAVTDVFVDLYNKGKIYRGVRMVNWDPKALTAVSDEEVIYKELQSKLYYVRYQIEGEENEYITIATTRPETILGDTAICMHPEDGRYAKYKGKRAIVPLVNRSVPLIYDEYVEREFGTGALKITPAHDINDYNLGIKHHLETINIFNDNGTLSEAAQFLVGMDRFEARKAIIPLLEEAGSLVKIEDYTNKVGFSERTNEVIEPKLSMQWFCKMGDLAKPALDAVMNGDIRFHPEKFKNTYAHWMENVKDWCISRQLWWGQRIPAWYLPDGQIVVEATPEAALEAAKAIDPALSMDDIRQDEDVLDTWFSSWLWPISVFDPEAPGNPAHRPNADLRYYYPTNDLVTGPDILFFWVARMIMAGEEFMGREPFSNVYLTGIVRDKIGRKMSKTLGNSPDPLDLIDKYGADAVRIGMLLCSSAGNDIFYDESQIKQGAAFCNKIWNSYRLVKGFTVDESATQTEAAKTAVKWFGERLSQVVAQIEDHYSKFRISDALMSVYRLFWDDYCSWYLEAIKPAFVDGRPSPMDRATYDATLLFFEDLLKLIHPVMPFITEELWQDMAPRGENATIMFAQAPVSAPADEKVIAEFAVAEEVVNFVRGVRSQKNLAPKEALSLEVKAGFPMDVAPVIAKLANLSAVSATSSWSSNEGVSGLVRTYEVFVPLDGLVDAAEEIAKGEKELERLQGFLRGVRAKLSNERFVANAPAAVIENERRKEADALSKIDSLEEQLKKLRG